MTGCLAFGVLSALEQPLPTRQQRFPVGLAVVAEPCCTDLMEPRQRATEMLSVLLGISHASTENLFDLASQVLGPSRTEAAWTCLGSHGSRGGGPPPPRWPSSSPAPAFWVRRGGNVPTLKWSSARTAARSTA